MADIKCKPMPSMTEADIKRFWSKVDKKGQDECWEWLGGLSHKRHATFTVNDTIFLSHRICYFIANSKDPAEKLVCHSCDNPPCCNPAHLWLGTHQDNVNDMMAKGRASLGAGVKPEHRERGDRHWTKRMPERLARGDSQGARLHPETLKRGDDHWSRRMPDKVKRGSLHWRCKLTGSDKAAIKDMASSGVKIKQICEEFNISKTTAWRVVKNSE